VSSPEVRAVIAAAILAIAVCLALAYCREERKGSPPGKAPVVVSDWRAALNWLSWRLIRITWRWRYTMVAVVIIIGLATGATVIALRPGLGWLAVSATGAAAALWVLLRLPPARRQITGLAWCVITPWRVGKGCFRAWGMDRDSQWPMVMDVVWTRTGERVLLWCPGIKAEHLTAARDDLVTAFWALDVRAVPSLRQPHVVALEIVRRTDPG
jgi:hypothetical protein